MKVIRITPTALILMLALLLLAPLALGPTQSVSASGGNHAPPTPTPPAGPPAPAPLTPASGASVTVPFTLSWSAVTDPAGILAYNWEISPSSSMAPVIANNSTMGPTQSIVSGLANGTYYWHVQAVNNNVVQGAWSAPRSFVVTGANSGELPAPTLNPPRGATAFHPLEEIFWTWSAVPGAVTYNLDASSDPNFPVITKVHVDNDPNPSYILDFGDSMPTGTWYVRVQAVDASGIASIPSNVQTFVLSFNAPLPPPPSLLTPANGSAQTLPVTLTWTDVPNPQDNGYILEVASDPGFANLDFLDNQITGAHYTITSLPSGTKYWRVRATQGDSAPSSPTSPGVPAVTAPSATGTFVVPATPPTVGSLTAANTSPANGAPEVMFLQLTTPAQAGGAVVTLTSSNPAVAPIPASYAMSAGFAWAEFQFTIGAVSVPTPITLTASVNGASASTTITR